jgi:hypothetical protein
MAYKGKNATIIFKTSVAIVSTLTRPVKRVAKHGGASLCPVALGVTLRLSLEAKSM